MNKIKLTFDIQHEIFRKRNYILYHIIVLVYNSTFKYAKK